MLIEKWIGYEFESSSGLTQEFVNFVKDFKKAVISQLPEGYKLVSFSRGHFYVSGFIQNSAGKYVYFSIRDVRFFKNAWCTNILIRTAKNDKDFTGGANCFCDLINFGANIAYLLKDN